MSFMSGKPVKSDRRHLSRDACLEEGRLSEVFSAVLYLCRPNTIVHSYKHTPWHAYRPFIQVY